MILVLLGPPGSGKGTQGALLKQRLGFEHVSTGDMLRSEVSRKTPLGLKAQEYMNQGLLVPDQLIVEMIKSLLSSAPDKNYVFDGFPRTVNQAEAFEDMLKSMNLDVDKVFYFDLDDDIIVKRLSGRRVCPKCGATYNIYYQKPKNDSLCDYDNTPLVQREDDKEEVIINRLKVYKEQTSPLVEFYKNRNKLYVISALGSQEEVFERLKSLL
ncbi:adenylate kinase [Hydrogenobaculum acidophilum]